MKSVLKDLRGRDKKWLRRAGKQMARVMVKEWKAYAEWTYFEKDTSF